MSLSFFLNSCAGDRCAKIEFVDSIESVQLKIIKLDSILKIMNYRCNAQYDILFNQDTIFTRNRNITFIYKPELFCYDNTQFRHELSQTLKALKRNHINAVFKDNNVYVYNFELCNPSNEFELLRYIIVKEDKTQISSRFKVLDTNGKLMLIAPRNQ